MLMLAAFLTLAQNGDSGVAQADFSAALAGWKSLAYYYGNGVAKTHVMWPGNRFDAVVPAKLKGNSFVMELQSKRDPGATEIEVLNQQYRFRLSRPPNAASPGLTGYEIVPRGAEVLHMEGVRQRFCVPAAWAGFSVVGFSLVELERKGRLRCRSSKRLDPRLVQLTLAHDPQNLNHDWFKELIVDCDPQEFFKILKWRAINDTWRDPSGKDKPVLRLDKQGVVEYAGLNETGIPLVKSCVITFRNSKGKEELASRNELLSFKHEVLPDSDFMLTGFGLPERDFATPATHGRYPWWTAGVGAVFVVLLVLRMRLGRRAP